MVNEYAVQEMKKANLKLEKRIEINVYRIAPIAGI
jgi:hypothetical protein